MKYERVSVREPEELNETEEDGFSRESRVSREPWDQKKSSHSTCGLVASLVICLCVSNAITGLFLVRSLRRSSLNAKVEGARTVPFHTITEYSSPDRKVSDAAWGRYTVNGMVAIPLSLSNDKGWPAGMPMPGNQTESIHVVDGFHQLHCLVCLVSYCCSAVADSNAPRCPFVAQL